jgi:RNA polymerase sigma-70 factor (ECF subfamily)
VCYEGFVTTGVEEFVAAGEAHRRELLTHCYRMLGSLHDAEDAVQETMVRAWRSAENYDASRASLRTWLYRIATNACLTALKDQSRRSLPADLSGPSGTPEVLGLERRPEIPWLEPFPTSFLDPATIVEERDTIRLAFVAALQHLPPRQRAVVILRDVLAMRAAEVADLLDTTTVSVNSALQRARTQLSAVAGEPVVEPAEAKQRELLDRYVAAFADMDVEALTSTLREDALLQMPPFPAWFLGVDSIGRFMASVFARGGSFRVLPAEANGQTAIALYLCRGTDEFRALHIQVLTFGEAGIARIDGFHGVDLFPAFGLPLTLPLE